LKIEPEQVSKISFRKAPVRCTSRKDIRPKIKRNNSEFNIQPSLSKVSSVINITFSQNPQPRSRRSNSKSYLL
jgi:hypothetical protein